MSKANRFYTAAKNIAILFAATIFIAISFILAYESITSSYIMSTEGNMREWVTLKKDVVFY